MKFFHLSDLHIGKQLNGWSLKENQEAVLSQVVEYAKKLHPDAILICGDIYDKTVPSGEAYTMFGDFLGALSEISPKITVLIIAGNHDSPERLSYAGSFLEKHHIHLSVFPPKNQDEYLKKVVLQDEFGPVNFYLMPFFKPGYVRTLFKDNQPEGYEEAVRAVLKRENIDDEERNVILSHQFYAGGGRDPETCESEQAVIMTGGLDRVDASLLTDFDYAALGHIHGSQKVLKETIRYCGTPYKYSVSEEYHRKSIPYVTMKEKGQALQLEFLPLSGIQDVRRERGKLDEILSRATEENRHDFVSVTITDEEEPYRIRERLEEVFDHLLELRIDNERTRSMFLDQGEPVPVLNPMEAFLQFYQTVRNDEMTPRARKVMEKIIQEAKEEEGL
ncbi:exonuclease SbcCD subunit D [Lacrimispora aerotolerans]|uniref:exonuclease SbcCD subunit D n=1 Tax=Lacrimispora aerotolerans TaxID=36832 RepID=UPI00047E53CA|nr:exonuclease SbcCD subunit D [Lacrimispora aerotolerans]